MKNSLTLVLGKEEFLKREAISEIRARLFPSGTGSLDWQEFSGEDGTFAFLDFLKTASFFGGRKGAVLRDFDSLEPDARGSLAASLKKLPDSCAAIIVSSESNAKRDPALRELAAAGTLVTCHPPFDNEWSNWLQGRARKKNLQLDRPAADALVERVGRDAAALVSALEALALHAHPSTKAGLDAVEALFGRSLQADAFKLMDYLVAKDAASAARLAATLREEGTHAFELVAVLGGQIEKLRRAADLTARGAAPEAVGERLRIHPFFLEKTVDQAKRLGRARAARIFRGLLDCDDSIKTGKLPENLALDRFLAAACS